MSGTVRALVGLVAAAAVVAVAVALALTTGTEGRHGTWPDEIAPLARFVEQVHGTPLEPVPVSFLADDAFERAAVDAASIDEATRDAARDASGLLVALGLAPTGFSLLEAREQQVAGSVAAFYDHRRDRIVVRGTELDELTRATLVHELVHAAQDRLGVFDAPPFTTDDGGDDGEGDDDASDLAAFMALAVVEGDATRVQQQWIGRLPPDEARELTDQTSAAVDRADEATADVPVAVRDAFEAPYALGSPFVRAVRATDGATAVAELLRDPPGDDLGLLDPAAWLDGARAAAVDRPEPDEGSSLGESELGAVGWFSLLAHRLPPARALDAADGWGGDASVAWSGPDGPCARLAVRGRTAEDTAVLRAALDEWVAAGGTEATAAGTGGIVTLTSCADGTDRPAVPTAGDALVLASVRGAVQAELLEADLGPRVARCTADELVTAVPFDDLTDDPTGALAGIAPAALARCRTLDAS